MYQVKMIYVQGKITEFLVVNMVTKKVQSSWKFQKDAKTTAEKLNTLVFDKAVQDSKKVVVWN